MHAYEAHSLSLSNPGRQYFHLKLLSCPFKILFRVAACASLNDVKVYMIKPLVESKHCLDKRLLEESQIAGSQTLQELRQ